MNEGGTLSNLKLMYHNLIYLSLNVVQKNAKNTLFSLLFVRYLSFSQEWSGLDET